MKRSKAEWIFIILFVPAVIAFYAIYKYPDFVLGPGADTRLLGKSLGFWYTLVYTAIVCFIAARVVLIDVNFYSFKAIKPKGGSKYQKGKFASIFLVQSIGFFLLPYVILPLTRGGDFWNDTLAPSAKTAHVYVYPGFQSWGMAAYLFLIIPVFVYFFGKRYCSWICSCGNLAETIGVTVWGQKWVKEGTPRGEAANKNHWIQKAVMFFAFGFGALLLFDSMKIIAAPDWTARVREVQDFGIDFMFGSVIGVGAYPFWGTRMWCRYGCPLAKFMELTGKVTKSRFQVQGDENCKGLELCTKACPMGIPVGSYVHKDKKPTHGHFGLENTVCIGCGGCIDVCPTRALSFSKIRQGPESSVTASRPVPS